MTALTLRFGARVVRARVGAGGEVAIDDSRFTVVPVAPGIYRVDDGARRWQVAVADAGDGRWVSVDGQIGVLEIDSGATRGPRRKTSAAGTMMTPMPATVVKVLVEPGQAVREGETVLLLEAMKMELPIRSPRDGVVSAVRCAQGELVQPGMELVELT
jgi:3-methylcrotonyl-CoA carboxylase alpha subunit